MADPKVRAGVRGFTGARHPHARVRKQSVEPTTTVANFPFLATERVDPPAATPHRKGT